MNAIRSVCPRTGIGMGLRELAGLALLLGLIGQTPAQQPSGSPEWKAVFRPSGAEAGTGTPNVPNLPAPAATGSTTVVPVQAERLQERPPAPEQKAPGAPVPSALAVPALSLDEAVR